MPAATHRGGFKLVLCTRLKLPLLLVAQESVICLETELVLACRAGTVVVVSHRENSDVLLFGSVAVAVTTQPAGTVAGSTKEKLVGQRLPKIRLVCARNT